jgi:hypothetical protein
MRAAIPPGTASSQGKNDAQKERSRRCEYDIKRAMPKKKTNFYTIAQRSKRLKVSKQALHEVIAATPPRLKSTPR